VVPRAGSTVREMMEVSARQPSSWVMRKMEMKMRDQAIQLAGLRRELLRRLRMSFIWEVS